VDEHFVPVCDVDDIPDIRPFHAEIGGRGLLICRSGGDIYAVDERCPHEDQSMRYGIVRRGRIVCPHHQYSFELDTGECRKRCPPVHTFEVEIEDETVYVRAPWMD
jgi:nitrite reductase/ring-hydroxylating ferredoxin subunit